MPPKNEPPRRTGQVAFFQHAPVAYGGFEKDRSTLRYRCPARQYGYECAGASECTAKAGVRIPLDIDRRVFTPMARSSYVWQRTYKKRTAVERVNARLDVSYGFERHFIRGLNKMRFRCGLALIVMLRLALGRGGDNSPKSACSSRRLAAPKQANWTTGQGYPRTATSDGAAPTPPPRPGGDDVPARVRFLCGIPLTISKVRANITNGPAGRHFVANLGQHPMSARIKQKRSCVGVELVRLLAAEGERIFTAERAREFCGRVGLKEPYLWEALHHLRRDGWIVPLRRGLYALSSLVPGVLPVHEFEVAMALVDPAAISHWSAMHYHSLTDQISRKVFVLTTTDASVPRVRGTKAKRRPEGYLVGDTVYRFVQVKPERFFGTEKVWVGESRVTVTDPERTLLDGLSRPRYCGDFAEVLHAFEARADRLDLERIIDYALKLDAATAKRLGWVLEHQGIESARLDPLLRVPIKGYCPLDPTGPRRGPCHRRWMVQENIPGRVSR